jgi:RNA polymerase sigma-70 factor, ECF subfamily
MSMMAKGNGASLAELRDLYETKLADFRRVAAAIVGNRDVADDVVQEAFVRAVRARGSYARDGVLDAWVWRIVVNAARDARARGRGFDVDEPHATAADETAERRAWVRAAVEQLPERQRLILFLRYYADLDYRSIAETLSISDGTVAATLTAARARLRQLLTEVML